MTQPGPDQVSTRLVSASGPKARARGIPLLNRPAGQQSEAAAEGVGHRAYGRCAARQRRQPVRCRFVDYLLPPHARGQRGGPCRGIHPDTRHPAGLPPPRARTSAAPVAPTITAGRGCAAVCGVVVDARTRER